MNERPNATIDAKINKSSTNPKKFTQSGKKMLKKIFLKLNDYRAGKKFLNCGTTSINKPDDILNFRFYQFKTQTAEFFFNKYQKTNIYLRDTPHYQLARAWADNNPEETKRSADFYTEYLECSLGLGESESSDKISKYRELFDSVKKSNISKTPVTTKLSKNSDKFIVDGNHRLSIAAALNVSVQTYEVPLRNAFEKFVKIPGFYGNSKTKMPYQSIYFGGEIVIPGRRVDLEERLRMIPNDLIENKKIIDVASNVGMSSIFAKRLGAAKCLGIEYSKEMASLATKFSMFEGLYPAVSFRQFDVDVNHLKSDENFDTAFMFSIHDHLKSPAGLIDLVKNHISSHVVFEGHPGHTESNYEYFFNSGIFDSITLLGALPSSASNQKRNRKLWLCSVSKNLAR